MHPSKGLQEGPDRRRPEAKSLPDTHARTTASWFFDKAAFDEAKGGTAAGAFSLFINEAAPDQRRSKCREKHKRGLLIQWSMDISRERVLIKFAHLKRGKSMNGKMYFSLITDMQRKLRKVK